MDVGGFGNLVNSILADGQFLGKSSVNILPVKEADKLNGALHDLYSESVFSNSDTIVVLITV